MSTIYKARSLVNDMFSQFSRFIAPAYYHDRCERTLQMYVYIMHKREVLLSLLALLSVYILLLFIGLAGPNVDHISSVTAKQMFADSKINSTYTSHLLESGPFVVTTGTLSSYAQQLSLYISFTLKNEEQTEAFHKEFGIQLQLDGVVGMVDEHNGVGGHHGNVGGGGGGGGEECNVTIVVGNQTNSLYCGGRRCEPIRVLRLTYIAYRHYRMWITFNRLESVNEKYEIDDIRFEFRSINVSFTTLSIWFRFFFLLVTFVVFSFYMHHLYRFPVIDWSLEQKWTTIMLIVLMLANNPFYPLQFLLHASLPRLWEITLHTTLQCLLMLFWLCFYHGIRQNHRSLKRFYAFKLLLIGTIWFTVIYCMSWTLCNQLENPIFDELASFNQSWFLQFLSLAFYLAFIVYFIYLIILMFAAFTELRSMPYFDVRLKLQTFLMLFVVTISFLTIVLSNSMASNNGTSVIGGGSGTSTTTTDGSTTGTTSTTTTTVGDITNRKASPSSTNAGVQMNENESTLTSIQPTPSVMVSELYFLRWLPFAHFATSSATFLSIFSLVNIYICACAYYYRPSLKQLQQCPIVRDNPTLSMINDSDEEVLYGTEDDDDDDDDDGEQLVNLSCTTPETTFCIEGDDNDGDGDDDDEDDDDDVVDVVDVEDDDDDDYDNDERNLENNDKMKSVVIDVDMNNDKNNEAIQFLAKQQKTDLPSTASSDGANKIHFPLPSMTLLKPTKVSSNNSVNTDGIAVMNMIMNDKKSKQSKQRNKKSSLTTKILKQNNLTTINSLLDSNVPNLLMDTRTDEESD